MMKRSSLRYLPGDFLLFLFLSKVKRKREEIVTGALLAPVNDLFGRSLEQFFSRQE